MVVAELVEWLLPIPEVRGANPVIGKKLFDIEHFVYCQLCIEKTKIMKKRPFLKKKYSRRSWDYFFCQKDQSLIKNCDKLNTLGW